MLEVDTGYGAIEGFTDKPKLQVTTKAMLISRITETAPEVWFMKVGGWLHDMREDLVK
jgi:hypothetical protein